MTNLVNIPLAIALLLPICLISQINNPENDTDIYCNSQFHFCTEFPADVLPFQAILNRENGIILRSEDGTSEVVVAGYEFSNETSTEAVFLATLEQLGSVEIHPKIMSSLFGEDFYECFFILGHHFSYHKCFFFDSYMVRMEIRVPISNPVFLKSLRESISLDFQMETQKIGQRL